MESRRDEPPAVPEASERLLTQSTRALRLARELALSADSSTIAQLLARHVGEISGGGPTAVYLLGPGRAPVQEAAAGFLAPRPPRPSCRSSPSTAPSAARLSPRRSRPAARSSACCSSASRPAHTSAST